MKTNIESIISSFITECYSFLNNYGSLLDRCTYRLIKENYLQEIERKRNRVIELSTKIIQLIKSIVDLRLQQKSHNQPSISNDVLKKLHLEPIAEIPQEKMNTSLSTTQIYGNLQHKNHRTQMKNSQTCYTNFLSSSLSFPSNNYNEMNDIDSNDRLVKCYYRHIHEQINSIVKRFSHLLNNRNPTSSLMTDGKALIVAGHKLVFVLETLHEHVQQIHTTLIDLTTQLCETLKSFIQFLKQFSQKNSINTQNFISQYQSNIKLVLCIVQRIKQHCNLVS